MILVRQQDAMLALLQGQELGVIYHPKVRAIYFGSFAGKEALCYYDKELRKNQPLSKELLLDVMRRSEFYELECYGFEKG